MLGFHRILLATDFSPGATAALHYAAALARLSQATLQVLHVVDTRVTSLPHWTDVFRSTEVFAAKTATATEALQSLLTHQALAGLSVTPIVEYGHPTDHIIDATADVDLVVLGTQGAVAASQVGTVALQVAHRSPVPVLLIPPAGKMPELSQNGTVSLPLQRIVLALHIVNYAPQALTLSQTLARHCHAALSVLQVLDPKAFRSYPLDAGTGLSYNIDGTYALLQKRLEDLVPDTFTPAVERLVVIGDTIQTLVQQIHALRTDLVVMSVHTYGGLKKVFTSSTLDALLHQLPCPLLAVPFPMAL